MIKQTDLLGLSGLQKISNLWRDSKLLSTITCQIKETTWHFCTHDCSDNKSHFNFLHNSTLKASVYKTEGTRLTFSRFSGVIRHWFSNDDVTMYGLWPTASAWGLYVGQVGLANKTAVGTTRHTCIGHGTKKEQGAYATQDSTKHHRRKPYLNL